MKTAKILLKPFPLCTVLQKLHDLRFRPFAATSHSICEDLIICW